MLVDREEAETIARRERPDLKGEAVLVDGAAPVEYRDAPLPVWRVRVADDAASAIWIDARSGDVVARPSSTRRIRPSDLPLLASGAALGLLSVTAVIALWALRYVRWRRAPEGGLREA